MCIYICFPFLFVERLCCECCKVYVCCIWPEEIHPENEKS